MSEPVFHIGEKALLLPPTAGAVCLLGPRYIGTEVTVQSELMSVRELTTLPVIDAVGYLVELCDGHLAWVVPRILQKLPPAPPDWKSLAMRDDLVRDEKRPTRAPHPTIAGVLELIGQEIAHGRS